MLTTREPRLESLDGLRGLAALAVVIFHYLDRGPGLYPEIGVRLPAAVVGSYGVNVFFVLSGFVITMTLARNTPRTFALSRAVRLYPVYWLCVVITFATVTVFGLPGREVSFVDALVNLTMVQQFVGIPMVDGAYWTLSAELSFYGVAAILLLTRATKSQRTMDLVLPAWLAISAASALLRSQSDSTAASLLDLVFAWSPLFIAGIVLQGISQGESRVVRLALLPVVVGVMALRGWDEAIAAVVAILLVALAVWTKPAFLASSPLRWLGAISFALYLLHQNIGYVALRWLSPTIGQVAATTLVIIAILALASLVTYAFDVPVRRALRRRLLPSQPSVADAPPAA